MRNVIQCELQTEQECFVGERRYLFYKGDMGCQPPKDEEELPKMSAEEFFDIHT